MAGDKTASTKRNIVSSASEASDEDEYKGSGTRTRHCTVAKRRTSSRRSSIASNHHEKHYVEHNYHDHLRDPIEPEMVAIENPVETSGNKKRRGHRGGVATPFPEKLHYMLSKMEEEENTQIIAWQPHGRCFTVHKPKEFVEEIMPRYFKQTKLTSFQRQLNLYGFSRLTAGPDRGGYYHELFIRGRMDLCKRMVRTRVKGNGSKAASSPATEPNFYAMPPCTAQPVRRESVVSTSDEEGEKSIDPVIALPTEVDDREDSIEHEAPIDVERPARATSDDNTATACSTPPMSPIMGPAQVISSRCPPISLQYSVPNLPIVSPCEPKTVVSPPSSPHLLASLSIPDERSMSPPPPILEDIHSGDQVFFEGLPFHYLETKDVEDSLLLGR